MVDKTDYAEEQALDWIFDNTAHAANMDGCYVHLWTTDPANSPSAANRVQPAGTGYAPIQVTAANWTLDTAAAPRQYSNTNDIDFGVLDDAGSVTVAGVVLMDGSDATTANALYADALASSKTVAQGDEFKFNAGDLDVSED